MKAFEHIGLLKMVLPGADYTHVLDDAVHMG